jgi:hypothetical protein
MTGRLPIGIHLGSLIRRNRNHYLHFRAVLDSLKWLSTIIRGLPMRYFYSAAVLTLACGLAASPAAWGSHKPKHPNYSAKTKERKVKAHHGTVPTGSKEAHEAVKEHKAMRAKHPTALHRSVRRGRPETQPVEVAETIPPIPMKNGRLYVPPPLVGSLASLQRQNQRDDAEGLSRIEDDAQLNEMRRGGELVALPVSAQLRVNPDLPVNRRYSRPWTAKFLADTARAHYTRFHRPLQVNSAVRTVAYQRQLIRVNGNAAPAEGDTASPHLTGATIDIGKRGLSLSEIAWMRAYLLPLEQAGKIDVEEEFYQSCFHITVYKSYMPSASHTHHSSATLLAAQMR